MATMNSLDAATPRLSLAEKLWNINWGLVFLLCCIASFGFAMLYSAANGDLQPWAGKQMIRFAISLGLMLAVAVVDIRVCLRGAYLIYGIAFPLLFASDPPAPTAIVAQLP